VEAVIWFLVAVAIWRPPERNHRHQQVGVMFGSLGCLLFGATDLLEINREGNQPLWQWFLKISSGVLILTAKFTWQGWPKFSWRQKEVKFAMASLIAVIIVIAIQHWLHDTGIRNRPVVNYRCWPSCSSS
jgi:peptidoglycan/LPS O-acetylase OafA/YrhL